MGELPAASRLTVTEGRRSVPLQSRPVGRYVEAPCGWTLSEHQQTLPAREPFVAPVRSFLTARLQINHRIRLTTTLGRATGACKNS